MSDIEFIIGTFKVTPVQISIVQFDSIHMASY